MQKKGKIFYGRVINRYERIYGIKKISKDTILTFRLGDFYDMFYEKEEEPKNDMKDKEELLRIIINACINRGEEKS